MFLIALWAFGLALTLPASVAIHLWLPAAGIFKEDSLVEGLTAALFLACLRARRRGWD